MRNTNLAQLWNEKSLTTVALSDMGINASLPHYHCRMATSQSQFLDSEQTSPGGRLDRHRGGGHPPTPATPPCVRVRTRRFELVALEPVDQGRKTERFEVRIGKPNRRGLGPSEVPGSTTAAGRIAGQSRPNP